MARTGPTSARAAAPSSSSSSSPHSSTNSNADLVILSSSDDDDDRAAMTTHKMRRRGPVYQKWLFRDVIQVLTWLAAERRRSGAVPTASVLFKAIKKRDEQYPALMEPERDDPPPPPSLQRRNLTADDLKKKVSYLKTKFKKAVKSGGPGNDHRNKTLYALSREIWLEIWLKHRA